jgi:hypothetical protein
VKQIMNFVLFITAKDATCCIFQKSLSILWQIVHTPFFLIFFTFFRHLKIVRSICWVCFIHKHETAKTTTGWISIKCYKEEINLLIFQLSRACSMVLYKTYKDVYAHVGKYSLEREIFWIYIKIKHILCVIHFLHKPYSFWNNQVEEMLWIDFWTFMLNRQPWLPEHNGNQGVNQSIFISGCVKVHICFILLKYCSFPVWWSIYQTVFYFCVDCITVDMDWNPNTDWLFDGPTFPILVS